MPTTIRFGSRGTEVLVLQAQLNLAFPDKTPLALDGAFGPLTRGLTVDFQRSKGLAADAVVGPKTWGQLALVRGRSEARDVARTCGNGTAVPQAKFLLVGQALANRATPRSGNAAVSSFAGATPTSGTFAAISVAGMTIIPLVGSKHEATARGVYGTSLHYDRIFLSDAKGLEGRAFTAPVPVPPLVVDSLPFGGTIQVLNIGTSPDRDTLIHELGHAWQSQHHKSGHVYAANCITCQGAALAANKLIAEIDPSVKSHARWPVNFPMSAYAYRPGKAFGEYAGEQIAQQIERGETPILSRVTGAAAGANDSENMKSVAGDNVRIEDRRASGVKM